MTFARAAEHITVGHAQVVDTDLAVVVAATHGFYVTFDFPALTRDVDQEGGVPGLRDFGVVLGLRNQDRELRTACSGDEPLVSVDHPVIAVAHRFGLHESRVGARNFGLRHGEARARRPLAQRHQVLLFLFVRRPMKQRVHVAFVGRLRVQSVGAEACLCRFGRNRRHRNMAKSHATDIFGHMREPESPFLCCFAHHDDLFDQRLSVVVVVLNDFLGRAHNLIHKVANFLNHKFNFFGEAKINGHGTNS